MGGDTVLSYTSSSEDVSLSDQVFPHKSIDSSVCSEDDEGLSDKSENGSMISGMKFINSECHVSSSIDEAAERQRSKVYSELLRSYEELQSRIDRLEGAKNKILSYTPGSWVGKTGGMDLSDYDVPNATLLLLIGPEGSGKSSLVNNISRALEDDVPISGRAQVSYNYSAGDGSGTCFLHEYLIPRGSGHFCLYDTRSLSINSSENQKMLNRWMTKGVRHGEVVVRKSDSMTLKAQLKCKARRCFYSSQFRAVDFVIFVVNGISVLESMDSDDEMKQQYSQMIASDFNNPLLSFKDDKPVVVITHGDLLSLSDRVRVRIYVGELLGVSPTRQIFDIPENNEEGTKLAIYDMLIHCLDRADRNLPTKDWSMVKVCAIVNLFFWIVMAVFAVSGLFGFHARLPRQSSPIEEVEIPSLLEHVDWAEIRHLWSD